MLKKIGSVGSALSHLEMKQIKGGITVEMDACLPGAWGCWMNSFCHRHCDPKVGAAYCCNECPAQCEV